MPDITVMLGDSEVGKYHLDGSEISIGRAEGNDVRINNLSVSRRHAKILREGAGYSLVDLDSSNGSYVNGDRVERAELSNGDKLGIGKHVLIFNVSESGAVDMYSSDYMDTIYVSKPRIAPKLRVFAPGQREAAVTMSGNTLRIGRGSANDVRLTDWFVEMLQAEIRREDVMFRLVDLSTAKTTLLNDMPVPEDAWLSEGDIIQVGVSRLVFSVLDAQEVTAEVPVVSDASDDETLVALAEEPAEVSQSLPGTGIVSFEEMHPHWSDEPTVPVAAPEAVETQESEEEEVDSPAEAEEPASWEPAQESVAALAPNYSPEDPIPFESGPVHAEAEAPVSQDYDDGNVDDKTIIMWERALQNKSVLIRKQAAERLKKITGRDYDY